MGVTKYLPSKTEASYLLIQKTFVVHSLGKQHASSDVSLGLHQ